MMQKTYVCPYCGKTITLEESSVARERQILELIKQKSRTWKELLEQLGCSAATLYAHLRNLENKGLIRMKVEHRDGRKRHVYYYTGGDV